MRYQITGFGDCVEDIFIAAPSKLLVTGRYFSKKKVYLSFPYGDKLPVKELNYDLGGSACNAIVAMAKLDIKTAMATVLGNNAVNSELFDVFRQYNISSEYIDRNNNARLGISFILAGPTGDRTILMYSGGSDFKHIDVPNIVKNSDAIYVAGIAPYSKILQGKILRALRGTRKKMYMNPSSYQLHNELPMLKKMIARCEAVSMNFEEAQLLTGKVDAGVKELLALVKKMGVKKVIITKGREGAYYHDSSHFLHVGVFKIKSRGGAGSGDAFFGTFISSQIKGESVERSLELAAINGAFVAGYYGAQKGQLTWQELKKVAKKDGIKIRKI